MPSAIKERTMDERRGEGALLPLCGQTIRAAADYVNKHIGDLAKNADLSQFIIFCKRDLECSARSRAEQTSVAALTRQQKQFQRVTTV